MENQYNLEIKSEILERQASYLFDRAHELLGEQATDEEVLSLVNETIRRYYVNLGRPLTVRREAEEGHLPFIEDYNETIHEMTEDMGIIFNEVEKLGDYLADYFNYAQSEKMRLQHRIRGLTGASNDMYLIANDTAGNSIYFRDSFDDSKSIESSMIMGNPAQVATQEGVVTLSRKKSVNRSKDAKVKSIQGNGSEGTHHLVRRSIVETRDQKETVVNYVSEQIPNDNAEAVLDGRPDTIFEYQMVNAERDDIIRRAKGYDFDWVRGKKENDKLRLKMTIELQESTDINWININPYHPPFSTGKVSVYSIRTSEDGFDYQGLYNNGSYVLNAELNTTPQTYRADALFDGSNDFAASKFSGQGVWAFPTRKARYVEVVFDQVESYEELIGHTYYERIKTYEDGNGNTTETRTRVPSIDVPKNIVDGSIGTYPIGNDITIEKGIEMFEGWRYAIGIRDVNIMSYEFEEKSEIISTEYESEQEIHKVMLYVNEKIPESYLDVVSTSNDWIKYFVTFDDVNWHRISPMHHQPVSEEGFPPKVIELNGHEVNLEASFQIHKTYVNTEQPVHKVRLKAVFERPKEIEGAEFTTPIIEDYAIRAILVNDSMKDRR